MAVQTTSDMLNVVKAEAQTGYDLKKDWLHVKWRQIIDEFRTNSFGDVADYLWNLVDATPETAIATDGRLPVVNIIVRKLVASVAMRNPAFTITNTRPHSEAIAELLDIRFEQLCRDARMHKLAQRALMDCGIFGTAFMVTGFSSEYVYGETAWRDSFPNQREAKERIKDELAWPSGLTTEYGTVNIQPGSPSIFCPSPLDVWYDPSATSLATRRRIYRRMIRPLVDIMQDERYSRKVRSRVPGVMGGDLEEELRERGMDYETYRQSQYGEVIEVFDIASRQFMHFHKELDRPLREWTDFGLTIENPYHELILIPDPLSPWGIPFACLFLDMARSINQLNAKTISDIGVDGKIINLYDDHLFDQAKIDELQTAVDRQWVGIPNLANLNKETALQQLQFTGANPQLLELRNDFWTQMNWATGLTDAARNTPSKKMSASEFIARQDEQGVTIDEMREKYEDFLEEVGADLCRIMLQKWDDTEMIKVVGNDPRMYFWVEVERSRVLESFTLQVAVGSTEKQNKAVLRRQWSELLPTIVSLKQVIDQEQGMVMQGMPPSPVDGMEILRQTLELFDRRIADKILRRRDPAALLRRLAEQGMMPATVSPELAQSIVGGAAGLPPGAQNPLEQQTGNVLQFPAAGGGPVVPPVGVTPQEANRIARPMEVAPSAGPMQGVTPAGVQGNLLAKMMTGG